LPLTMKIDNEQKYREDWERVYRGINPFDLETPEQWVVELEENRKIRGKVLDSGCGSGRNAIYLASKGYSVVGIDISETAIKKAKQKAAGQGIKTVEFLCQNVVELSGHDNEFDTVVDIGLFHSLDGDDPSKYTEALHKACKPNAVVFLRTFSDSNSKRENYKGPQCTEKQIRAAFSEGWKIGSLEEKEIKVMLPDETVTAYAWFAEIYKN